MTFDSRIVPDILSDAEIAEIIPIVMSGGAGMSRDDPNPESGHHAVTQWFDMEMPMFRRVGEILLPRLRQHFGEDLHIDDSHFLTSIFPYSIHTDVMSGEYFDLDGPLQAAWTFIIPLDDYDSYTVVFNEGDEHIKTVDEWIDQRGIKPHGQPVDEELYQRRFSHMQRHHLDYLTIESMFHWRKGHLFAADRRKFHSSDNHPAVGVPEKRGIIMWTSVPR